MGRCTSGFPPIGAAWVTASCRIRISALKDGGQWRAKPSLVAWDLGIAVEESVALSVAVFAVQA